jgi:hypothetical protein
MEKFVHLSLINLPSAANAPRENRKMEIRTIKSFIILAK